MDGGGSAGELSAYTLMIVEKAGAPEDPGPCCILVAAKVSLGDYE